MSAPAAIPIALEPAERIHILDLLRGFALLGMIIVHFHDKSTEPGGVDDFIRTFIWRFIESKSHGTFAVLFGAGFAILLRRAEMRGRPIVPFYLRRLFVLAFFGFAAHALFGFNVLLGYALWGVPLLLIRSWSTRALIVTALLSATSVPVYYRTQMAYLEMTGGPAAVEAFGQARQATAMKVYDELRAAEAQDSYSVLLAARLRHMAWFYRQPFVFLPDATLMLFLTGFLFIRHRVFEEIAVHRRFLIAFAAYGFVSWLFGNWLLELLGWRSFGLLRDQWLTFTYISLVLLLLNRAPSLATSLRTIGLAGRMALTNYLIQIAVIDLLFSAYALGLGKIRPLFGPPMAFTLFALEVVFSIYWLKRFQFGPAEWIWRSATYGRLQPLRRDVVVPQRQMAEEP